MIALVKRIASLSELVAAGAFLVGLFQDEKAAFLVGGILTACTLYLTWLIDRHERGAK
jgi:hypothetical protein